MTTSRYYIDVKELEGFNDDTPAHDMPAIVPTIQVEDFDLEISHFTGNAISSPNASVILSFTEAKSALALELTDSLILGRD